MIRIRRVTKDDFTAVRNLYFNGMMEVVGRLIKKKVIMKIPVQVTIAAVSILFGHFLQINTVVSSCFTAFTTYTILYLIVFHQIRTGLKDEVFTEGDNADSFISEFSHNGEVNFWVAEELTNGNFTLVGCVGLSHMEFKTESLQDTFMQRTMKKLDCSCGFQLKRMSVIPSYRRTGVARKMMAVILDYVEQNNKTADSKIKDIFLETTTMHPAAISLYRTYGFQHVENTPVKFSFCILPFEVTIYHKQL